LGAWSSTTAHANNHHQQPLFHLYALSSLFSICFRIKRLVGIEENISEYAPYCISPAVTKQALIILSNFHLQKPKPVLGNICNTSLYYHAIAFGGLSPYKQKLSSKSILLIGLVQYLSQTQTRYCQRDL
jgi:hypothetical protein